MTKELIKKYIDRTKKYRAWFAELPAKAIDLDVVLSSKKKSLLPFAELTGMSVKKALGCGTAGCVEGWLRIYPPYKKSKESVDKYMGNIDAYTEMSAWMFEPRNGTHKTERAEALARLDTRVKELQQELVNVGKA